MKRHLPVTYQGKRYASLDQAILATGHSEDTIRYRLKTGSTGRTRKRPYVWNGREYESVKAMAQALHLTERGVYRRLQLGYTSDADLYNKGKRK